MSAVRIGYTMPRRAALARVAALARCCPAPALAQQEPPPALFESTPAQDPGTAAPSDDGRSLLLLGLSLVAVAGAGVLAAIAMRGPAKAIFEADAAPARRSRRVSAARAASAEASAAARLGMPVIPVEAPAAEKPCWRPRVAAPAPLPAFGPGAGPPPPPPPPPVPPQRLSR
jgi:hypothetical protein